jgi:hypothetical protein
VEEFNYSYVGSMITNDARCTREIKARIAMAKVAFNKKTLLTSCRILQNSGVLTVTHHTTDIILPTFLKYSPYEKCFNGSFRV